MSSDRDDLDFTSPAPATPAAPSAPFKAASSPFYKAEVAALIFKSAGRAERFEAGQTIFAEDEKTSAGGLFSQRSATRMYYLAEGEVAISVGGRPLDTLTKGEIFGEMAVISEQPRAATAAARIPCAVLSMNAEELRGAMAKLPEFAMMLMSVMFDRLRFLAARLAARNVALAPRQHEGAVFDPALLAELEGALRRPMVTRFAEGAHIMREGQAGACAYVVKAGRVAIAIRGNIVEAVNAGGTFGEMALVDQSPRTASAIAETECELLAIDRPSLLEAMKQQPAFAMAILRASADRLRFMNSQLG
jgi:CRP-like cAMP-binding protein